MRWFGSPMKRTRLAAMSSSPPTWSCTRPSASTDRPLMVKSRRCASATQSRPNATFALRPNVSVSSRSVVTSNGRPSATSVTVPCSIPVGTLLMPAALARRITSSGSAVVAISMSPIGTSRSALRTAPPTTRASSPSPFNSSSTRVTGPDVSQGASSRRALFIFHLREPACRSRYGRVCRSNSASRRRNAPARSSLARSAPAMRARAWRRTGSARTPAPEVRNGSRSGIAHRPRRELGKFRSRSAPGGSWQVDPLIQRPQDPRGRAPDVALRIGHRVIGALHAAELPGVDLVVLRIHQERERHLEGIVDFRLVDAQRKAGPDFCHRRQDAEPEARAVEVEIADRIDEAAIEPDLFPGLAQRSVERRSVGRVDLAAGKRDLAGVVVEVGGALRQQHGRLRMIDDPDQHRGGTDRLFAGDDLEHPLGTAIAAFRNDVGVDEARRNVEVEPRAGAGEKFGGADRFRPGLQHRLVQSAALTSSASAIGKNYPADDTPNT